MDELLGGVSGSCWVVVVGFLAASISIDDSVWYRSSKMMGKVLISPFISTHSTGKGGRLARYLIKNIQFYYEKRKKRREIITWISVGLH